MCQLCKFTEFVSFIAAIIMLLIKYFLDIIFLVVFNGISPVASRQVYIYGWSSIPNREDTVSAWEVKKVLNDPNERQRLSLSVDQVYFDWPQEVPSCLNKEELYNPISNNCSLPKTHANCGHNMIFLAVPNTENIGACACENSNCWGRPQVLASNNQCYGIGMQGPCNDGQVIVPITKFHVYCGLDACARNIPVNAVNFSEGSKEQPYFYPIFRFTYRGNCYATESEAFCPRGQIVRFVLPYRIPVCVRRDEEKCIEHVASP